LTPIIIGSRKQKMGENGAISITCPGDGEGKRSKDDQSTDPSCSKCEEKPPKKRRKESGSANKIQHDERGKRRGRKKKAMCQPAPAEARVGTRSQKKKREKNLPRLIFRPGERGKEVDLRKTNPKIPTRRGLRGSPIGGKKRSCRPQQRKNPLTDEKREGKVQGKKLVPSTIRNTLLNRKKEKRKKGFASMLMIGKVKKKRKKRFVYSTRYCRTILGGRGKKKGKTPGRKIGLHREGVSLTVSSKSEKQNGCRGGGEAPLLLGWGGKGFLGEKRKEKATFSGQIRKARRAILVLGEKKKKEGG